MFKNIYKTAIILVFSFFILAGCVKVQEYLGIVNTQLIEVGDNISGKIQLEQKKQADKAIANFKCQELCQFELTSGDTDFNNGPCLAEEIIPDWSCDIVHSPRQAVDDDPANQCASFRQGLTHHFVEVDGNCNRVKVY